MFRFLLGLMLLSGGALGALPSDDPRLASVKSELASTWASAARDGVPETVLEDKLREGLAKNVPAARLLQVLQGLETALAEAERLSARDVPHPPAALLKALVEARSAGAQARDLELLVHAGASRSGAALVRAIDVVTDLSQRGFPPAAASHTVATVLAKNPRAVDQIAAAAQHARLRVTPTEALDAISRAANQGLGPDHALDMINKQPPGQDDRGPNRETSGQRGEKSEKGKP
jgi:hypothetical protein